MKDIKKMILVGVICTPISWLFATVAAQEGPLEVWYFAASALFGTLAMMGLVWGVLGYLINSNNTYD